MKFSQDFVGFRQAFVEYTKFHCDRECYKFCKLFMAAYFIKLVIPHTLLLLNNVYYAIIYYYAFIVYESVEA